MDPWLEVQLRLADRRGVLRGASLSRVQELGLQMLMMVERRDQARGFLDELRSRIAANHPDRVRALFPRWFPAGAEEDDQQAEPDVEWRVPASETERAELERWIATHSTGDVAAAEVGEWV